MNAFSLSLAWLLQAHILTQALCRGMPKLDCMRSFPYRITYLYFRVRVCVCAIVWWFVFSSAGLHAVNVVYLCVCVLKYVSMYCMHGKTFCVTDLTPCFHAKVTPDGHILWLRWVMELTATQSDIESFTLLEVIVL